MDGIEHPILFPQFPNTLAWFNSPPLTPELLQGHLVVAYFWTSCCIHCQHLLTSLRKLEKKYKDASVIFLGIHSPKFPTETDDTHLKKTIERYDIHHPVVNDPLLQLWQELNIHTWPTLIVIGPNRSILFASSGEGKTAEVDLLIEAAVIHYTLHQPSFVTPHPFPQHSSYLRFPTNIAIDETHQRLFIADSGHHRIVICSMAGTVIDLIGNGHPGLVDDHFHRAQCHTPQGIAYHKGKLYIADTNNHALRCADLNQNTLSTLSGNGHQSCDYRGGKQGTKQSLNSPWGLALDYPRLWIAMAGTHQIWMYDIITQRSTNFSGTAQELHLDSDSAFSAAWAQPSGLSLHHHHLFIADSESSSIRSIDLKTGKSITLAGGNPENPYDLFAFGDLEGTSSTACFQHPLAILWVEPWKQLLIADTYNHRLKRLDPQSKILYSWIGNGTAGHHDGPLQEATFSQPSGLAFSKKSQCFFIADTNNHAVRVVDLSKHIVSTFLIKGL